MKMYIEFKKNQSPHTLIKMTRHKCVVGECILENFHFLVTFAISWGPLVAGDNFLVNRHERPHVVPWFISRSLGGLKNDWFQS